MTNFSCTAVEPEQPVDGFQPDTGPYSTRWVDTIQFIWRDDPDDCLILRSDLNRDGFRRLLKGFHREPEWDRETYEAYEYAMSKDD